MKKNKKVKKQVKTSKTKNLIVSCSILVLIAIVLIFSTTKGNDKMDEKVLVLGIDGMDVEITNKLIADGILPNFEKLVYNNLTTALTPQSPVSWSSIATGMNPGKTNIFDFIRRDPKNYLPLLSLSKTKHNLAGTNYEPYVRGEAYWDTLGKEKVPTDVIRWPMTFPASKLNGNLLAGLGVPDIKGLLSGYTYYVENPTKKSDKITEVKVENNKIKTQISGPRKRTSSGISDITVDMEIEIIDDNNIIMNIQNKKYNIELNKWTPWITLNFKTGFLKGTSGITKGYLESIKPFKMYFEAVQIDPKKPIFPISYPNAYAKELANEIGDYTTLGIAEDTGAYEDDAMSKEVFLEHVESIGDERDAMFWKSFNDWQNRGGLLAFVYDDSDRLQHMMWSTDIPNTIPIEIQNYYSRKDKLLGEILDKLDDETKLIVISDHGFTDFNTSIELNAWLVKEGYMTLTRAPKDGEQNALFKLVDWSKTKAYSVGFSGIYINLEGREGKGIVKQEEKEVLMEEIRNKLLELKEENSNNVVHQVYKSNDVYNGPYTSDSPDLIIGFKPGYRAGWESPIGGTPSKIFYTNIKKWKGDHIVDNSFVPGVLFTNFDVKKENPSHLDIAPTVIDLFGKNIPEDIDGTSLIR